MLNQSWRYSLLFVYGWRSMKYNAYLCQLSFGMNENQTSISKSNTNNTPFVSIKTKSEKDETIKEKGKNLHPKRKNWRIRTLTQSKMKRSIGLWWPSPRLFYPTDEERRTMHKSQISLNRENLKRRWRRQQYPINKMFIFQKDRCQG